MILTVLTAPAASQPTILEGVPPPARPGFRQLDGRWIAPAGRFEPRQIISTHLDPDGRLHAAFDPQPAWKAKLRSGRRVVAEHALDDTLWFLTAIASAPAAAGPGAADLPMTVVLLAVDESLPTSDAPPRLTRVTLTASRLLLRGIGRHDGASTRVEYLAGADGTNARLTVQIEGKGGLDVSGDDLGGLLSTRPQIVRQFLSPLLLDLSGNHLLRPRPGDVYRAFDAIEPTPEERAALDRLIPALNAPDPQERETASEQLRALGSSGVLAALRLDLDAIPPEPAWRIRQFVRENSLGQFEPSEVLTDLWFLRDALADADPRVREAARDQLQLLTD